MAKLITKYAPSVLLSVTQLNNDSEKKWNWRKDYVGEPGCLSIFESIKTYPGKRFVYMNCYFFGDLTTTCGEIVINGNLLTITTKNSRYEFKIGQELKFWQKSEKAETELSD